MLDLIRSALQGQMEAALSMLGLCVRACPAAQWDEPVAKYPFWMVAYHTLCYADCYAAPSDEAWRPDPRWHPRGRAELEDEYPSRRFEQAELIAYLGVCVGKARAGIARETPTSLAGPSGFAHLKFSRLEVWAYNLRHVQHHTGQLSAFVRRAGVDTPWVKSGWRE